MNKRQYKKHIGKYGLTYREIKESYRAQEKYRAEHNRKFRVMQKNDLFGYLSDEEKFLLEIGIYTVEELTMHRRLKRRHRAIRKELLRKR